MARSFERWLGRPKWATYLDLVGMIGWLLLDAGRRQTFGRVGTRLLENVGDSLKLASAGLAVLEAAACPVPRYDALEARIAEVLEF